MKTADQSHPPKDQLIAFGQGKLADNESSSVEQHLELCNECCATMLDLKDDTFVGLVRAARPERVGSEELQSVGTDEAKAIFNRDDSARSETLLFPSLAKNSVDELPDELRDHPRYRIVELIGRGGMGNVYRAEHRLMNRPVAIKLINSQLIRQPQAVERFRREVQAAAKLTHPNIVTAYDAEQAGDVHFLVMEFVEGTDLASVVKQRGPMSVVEACECIRQAAEGLQHAHEKGMVHRDIKPHNLMLSAEGQVRILDFGLAGFASEVGQAFQPDPNGQMTSEIESVLERSGQAGKPDLHLTSAGSVMGTPDYMAPEQAKDAHSADIRADIYSLGCTLHFLLTGKLLFEADNIVAKLKAHASEPPPSLSSLRKDVPAELSRVAARMLAKDPADRFQTPAEVVAALQACEKLVQPSARTRRFHWRRVATVVGLGMAGFVMFAGVIVLSMNRGWLEIRTQVDDLKVTVRNNGEQVEFSDLKTGSQVKWISGGKCDLEIVGNRNDVKLDKNSVTVSRFGHVIVTATWNVAGLDLIRSFAPTDKTISQDGLTSEAGGWKVTASSDRTAQLFEVSDPPFRDGGVYFCVAKLKSENVVGKAYLDMHSLIPRRMNAFIGSGVDRAISGTNDWQTIEVPMFLQPGEKPNAIKINVSIVGSGTVWIKDIELRGRAIDEPLKPSTEKSGAGPLSELRDQVTVFAYLNNPQNNRGGSVPVALIGQNGRVAFQFSTWLIVFEGIACDPKAGILGFSSFNIPHRGSSGEGTIDFGAGDKLPGVLIKYKFANEQNEISINNHRFKLRGKATKLEFDDKAYDATDSLQTILVARDGSTRLEGADASPGRFSNVGQFKGHSGSVYHAIISPGGRFGISCGEDKLIRVWDIATLEEKRVLKGHEAAIFGLAISADGKLLASGDKAKSIRLWNLETGEQVGELTGHAEAVTDLAFMPDRTHLLSAGFDDTLRLWHVADRKLVRTIDIGTKIEKLLPLPDGRRVMLSGAHTRGWGPRIYDLEKGEKIDTTLNVDSCMAVTADGRMMLIGSLTGVLRVTDTDKGNLIVQMTDPRANVARDAAARDAAITPDGRFAVTTTRENRMHLWDLHGGKLLATAESDTIGWISLSPDGRYALTIGQNRGIGVWRLPESVLEPIAAAPANPNLLTDPSFENTGLTQLPRGWRAWLNDGPEFRCEVVSGGHTGERCLQISGKGTRGVVFANDLKADRTKRYALKGWVKFEGDKDARALIKLNYFRGGEFLGVHDLVGATADQPGWHLFEKTDALDAYPTADHFYAMCHVEGSGTGWFDDLELVAYDRDKLPSDFDARHGRHNRLHGPNSLHRWVGTWDTEYAVRETDNSPQETKLAMTTTSERTLGDYFLMSHAKAKPPASEERLQFLLFDQNLGAFRQWVFSSNGKVFEWRGPWKNEKQTLELRMLPDASNLHSSEHFVDADHIEAKLKFQYVMGERDAGRWTATRKAFDGKVDVPIARTHVAEPAELSQLNKFAGEWTIHAKYKPSVWNPLPREETARETSVWILGGRFLMTRAFNEKDELTSIWIATYEPREKSNRFWFFNADGSSGEWRLTWDEPSGGFQFRAVDMPTGWSGTGFNRWVNEDSFDNQAVIKDEKGRVLLDSTQERRRKK